MNLLWRTLLTINRARRRARKQGQLAITDVSRVTATTLPTDIDLLMHMNNGRYLSLFDLGRWDLLVRSGLFDAMRTRGWYAVVGTASVTYRKSLTLWQRFEIQTRMIGHDDRAVYMEHRAVVKGEVYAVAIVRARLLKRSGGIVRHEELFAELGQPDGLETLPEWITQWAAGSALPSTKSSAPSNWD